jgi:uncharacterized protein (DUF2147 family)
MKHTMTATLAALLFAHAIQAQQNDVQGYWKEPGGSVIHVTTCGDSICATLVAISPTAPARVDGENPDRSLRTRTLCGVRIGNGFHRTSSIKAEGGTLYDPKSGKTYHGVMTAHGDTLDLRGYIGVTLFGRTETWTRTAPAEACQR